ncbi:hypothetical protein [Aureitalea sp. L0-47]|nr:hypothetical protein [Aureitalea sp. L0-47]
MSFTEFLESGTGIGIIAVVVPVVLGIIYVLAKNYKAARDGKWEE